MATILRARGGVDRAERKDLLHHSSTAEKREEIFLAINRMCGGGGGRGLVLLASVVQVCFATGPSLGWRSWNLYELTVSQKLLQSQVDGLLRVRHENRSLFDVGYNTIGLDDGWQACGPNGYHDPITGEPLVNLTRFPDMKAMTAYGATRGVKLGWYANNCGCHGSTDVGRYKQDAIATVRYGYTATKIDSCGPETNMSAWREELDAAAAAHGVPRIELENCRNYAFTQDIDRESACEFDTFRSTEDNSPHFASIMHNLMTNSRKPGEDGNVHGGAGLSQLLLAFISQPSADHVCARVLPLTRPRTHSVCGTQAYPCLTPAAGATPTCSSMLDRATVARTYLQAPAAPRVQHARVAALT